MTIKTEVDVTELYYRLCDILPVVENCITFYGGEGNILTSTSEGEGGRFAARRNVLVVEIIRPEKVSLVCRKLAGVLGPNYNIVEDNGIISIKWDPKQREVREMRIEYKNNAGILEKLICDCGNDSFISLISDESGDAFECVECGEPTIYFTEYSEIGKEDVV